MFLCHQYELRVQGTGSRAQRASEVAIVSGENTSARGFVSSSALGCSVSRPLNATRDRPGTDVVAANPGCSVSDGRIAPRAPAAHAARRPRRGVRFRDALSPTPSIFEREGGRGAVDDAGVVGQAAGTGVDLLVPGVVGSLAQDREFAVIDWVRRNMADACESGRSVVYRSSPQ
jgi:hypothetical protein